MKKEQSFFTVDKFRNHAGFVYSICILYFVHGRMYSLCNINGCFKKKEMDAESGRIVWNGRDDEKWNFENWGKQY